MDSIVNPPIKYFGRDRARWSVEALGELGTVREPTALVPSVNSTLGGRPVANLHCTM